MTSLSSVKEILLLGGGHANIQVLHHLATLDRSIFHLTLISESALTPYSGIIPSYLAGIRELNDLQFDLRDICRRLDHCFVEATVATINDAEKYVITTDGRKWHYDICSINLGCRPTEIKAEPEARVFYLKPIQELIHSWESLQKTIESKIAPSPFRIVLVGGGAAAFEVAIACRRRFGDRANIHVIAGRGEPASSKTDQRNISGFLAQFNWFARTLARKSLRRLSIQLSEGHTVTHITRTCVVLENQQTVASDVTIIATCAGAPGLFQRCRLPVDTHGFVEVTGALLVRGHSHLFAAGDCAHFLPRPLSKSGVYAVREGAVLKQNIEALLQARSRLKTYTPARRTLALLVSAPDEAIAVFGWLAIKSKWAWRLKNQIDLRFMARYR